VVRCRPGTQDPCLALVFACRGTWVPDRLDVFFGNVSAALALWRDGKVKVLAVTDQARRAAMPDVPTTAAAGLPALVSFGWFVAVAPPKTSVALQNEIARTMIEVLKLADVQAKFRALSVDPVATTPAETAAFIKDEARRWGEVIRQTGVMVE